MISSSDAGVSGSSGFPVVSSEPVVSPVVSLPVVSLPEVVSVEEEDVSVVSLFSVFPHDTASTDPAENPFAVLRKARPGDYTFRGQVRGTAAPVDGQGAWQLSMASKDRNAAYILIEFTISQKTLLPVSIVYESRNGDKYDLRILSARGLGALAQEEWTPPESLLENPEVYITDLR